MAAPKTTIWPAEPHTLAKHEILRAYLGAWFPILARYHGRLVYLDGFAGPGRYSNGEDGSPIIALKVATNHRASLDSELVFIFVEAEKARAAHLRDHEIPALAPPTHFKTQVHHGQFEPVLRDAMDRLDAKGDAMAPTFAFIDPFGISGLPFSLIERLLRRQHCETLITFMTSTVERFVAQLPEHVNELIGNSQASEIIARSSDRVVVARTMYEKSLRRVAKFVRFFQLRNVAGRPIYDLFFASNDATGHEKMKEAMWKVDESGDYSFSDGADPEQQILFSATPGPDLAPMLWRHFRGKAVYAEDVYRHVSDTAYLEKHARDALRVLENAAPSAGKQIEVALFKRDDSKRRAGTFPRDALIRFSS